MLRSFRRAALLAAVVSTGCIAQVQYSPNPNLLAEIGYEQGRVLFAQILTRVRQPRIQNVEVTPEWFTFDVSGLQVHWGWYGYTVGNRVQIFFNNIRNIDYYENERMMIYDLAGRRIAQFDMLNRSDGLRFLDLVAAFQNLGGQWPGPENPSPEPPTAPASSEQPEENLRQPLLDDAPPEPEPEPTYRDDASGGEEGRTRNLLDED